MTEIEAFFDSATSTLTYVAWDPASRDAIVLDPVLDYDPAASVVSEASVKKVIDFVEKRNLEVRYVLETHAHADHLSGSQRLKKKFPSAQVAIGERITEVQKTFASIFDLAPEFAINGRQFDVLLRHGEKRKAGTLEIEVRFTPGHTPACASYLVGNAVFTGDALFMPDSGVGRCDFPGASAETLYDSVTKQIYSLPDDTRVFTGHDYQPGGRPLRYESTIGEQKRSNVHLKAETTKEAFVKFRTERDRTLGAPKLLLPSLQINIDAGHLPEARANGRRYLVIPIGEKS